MDNTKLSEKLQANMQSPFLSDLDPTNPYGPNYEGLPQDSKIYYKFSKIRKYVHYDYEDQKKIMFSNIGFVSGMFLSGVLGVILSKFGSKYARGRLLEYIEDYHHLYVAVSGSAFATLFYSVYSDYYIQYICIPFIKKYEVEAIENGFETYQISQYRVLNFEDEYYNNNQK